MMLLPGTQLSVSRICLGTPGFGTDLTGRRLDVLFDTFIEQGGNFFDTAHCYAFWHPLVAASGTSERMLGHLIRTRGLEKSVVVATKGGHPAAGPKYPRPDQYLSPEVLLSDVRESLDRLGFAQLDLFLLHRDDPRVPVDEIMDALHRLVHSGLVKHVGASNWSGIRMAEANQSALLRGETPLVISSSAWNLALRNEGTRPDPTMREVDQEDEIWHRESQIPLMCYNSTASGWFARGGEPGACENQVNRARLARCTELAGRLKVTPGQIALAWLMAQPFPVIPITGTSNADHLKEAIGASQVKITPDQARWLREG